MRKQSLIFSVALLLLCCCKGAPFSFDSAPKDVQDFVVAGITNVIKGATIALVYEPMDQEYKDHSNKIPYYVRHEIGLSEKYCLEVLKGDNTVGKCERCYFYDTPRRAHALPPLFEIDGIAGELPEMGYYDKGTRKCPREGKLVYLTGKLIWRYFPPYDPFDSYRDEFVKLMLLTRETNLDVGRIKLNKWHYGRGTIADVIGTDFTNKPPAQIAKELGLESAFSNRVYRLNEACVFQVDYPIPDGFEWRGLEDRESHAKRLKDIQDGNTVLMRLSAEEVSEIVYLSYLADGGRAEEYGAAVDRFPKILKSVTACKTSIGIRLLRMLREGGAINE